MNSGMTELVKTSYIFPGQGSQFVGMGKDLCDNSSAAKAVLELADKTLGFPLSNLCFTGPETDLRQTVNAQPAILTVSLACLAAAREANQQGLPAPAFVAGHSLGEYTALAVAGVFDYPTAIHLARERGRLMYEAGQAVPGSMIAILGIEENTLVEICHATGPQIAN
jgi:[acyl-carrier-protein] S-malonyltransferase